MSKPVCLNLPPFDTAELRRLERSAPKLPKGVKVPMRPLAGIDAADAFFAIFGLTRVKREVEDEGNGKA